MRQGKGKHLECTSTRLTIKRKQKQKPQQHHVLYVTQEKIVAGPSLRNVQDCRDYTKLVLSMSQERDHTGSHER